MKGLSKIVIGISFTRSDSSFVPINELTLHAFTLTAKVVVVASKGTLP
jgi:hypothetical protein